MSSIKLIFGPAAVASPGVVRLVFGEVDPPGGSSVEGVGAGALGFAGAGVGAHGVTGVGLGVLSFDGEGIAEHGDPAMDGAGAGVLVITGAATAAHGIAGAAAGALAFTGSATAAHGISATGAGAIGFTGACVAVHLRYEVRGEVRLGGILVNRRVRCYKRSTGELTGQADTVAGRYRVHAGFDDAEVTTMAIDLAEGATDWIPPTANRLVPVLADDTA